MQDRITPEQLSKMTPQTPQEDKKKKADVTFDENSKETGKVEAKQTPALDKLREIEKKIAVVQEERLQASLINEYFALKRKATMEMLDNEEKIRLTIPFQIGEDQNNKGNWYQFFGVNGVYINVRKGMPVYVPISIDKLYQDSIAQNKQSSENLLGNIHAKIDPQTGEPKSSIFLR